jgi:hypothetical protein
MTTIKRYVGHAYGTRLIQYRRVVVIKSGDFRRFAEKRGHSEGGAVDSGVGCLFWKSSFWFGS